MTPETLHLRLSKFPRRPLSNLPTPMYRLQRLTEKVGGPQLWIKRDDDVGPGLGGNKGRGLEFLMAEALKRGKRKVVTFGGLQSNHARMTAAAGAKLEVKTHLLFFERRPRRMAGNLLLNDLFGADMTFIPFGGGGDGTMTIEMTIKLVKLLAVITAGPGAHFIPVGGHSLQGALGYVTAAMELREQMMGLGMDPVSSTLVTAAGSGTTLAGLMAGFTLLDFPVKLLAIDVGGLWKSFPESIARLATEVCDALEQRETFAAEDVPMIEDRFVGSHYGAYTAESGTAIKMMARSEGILLDPVYTGKAFAGLLAHIGSDRASGGRIKAQENIIFLHTGGLPTLAAYSELLVGSFN